MDEMTRMEHIDNITANNYLTDLKKRYEVMKPKKKPGTIGRIVVIVVIILVLAMIINPPNSGLVFVFMISILPFLLAVALMCTLAANLDRMNVRSILKQAEKDIASGKYITKKIIYGNGYSEYFMQRLTEEERASYNNPFISMIMYDARNKSQTYRFNGKGVLEIPFEYGMILEITYLPKSKVINRVNIVQEA